MKNFTKILILSIFTILMIGGFANNAFAVSSTTTTPLSVTFSATPLFSEANFIPGNEVLRTINVANNSGESKNVIIEATNAIDKDGLGDKLNLVITEGESQIYNNTLGKFLRAGEVALSSLSNSSDTTYSLGVTFESDAGNDLQNKKLGFDLCVGFQGGEMHCGITVIAGENGGGGGGISGSVKLIIWNEKADNISGVGEAGSATITWNTNKLATSQVIYGLKSAGPYTLDLDAPNFGYPFSNIEDPIKVMDHSMVINGLIPGETYSYRVVSRASPATVSFEHEFSIPIPTPVENILVANNTQQGEVLGANAENIPEEDGEVAGVSTNNLSAAVASGFKNIISPCFVISLAILIILYLIWKLWLRRRFEKQGIEESEIQNKFYLFFAVSSVVALLVLLILGQYCPLIVFLIIFIISISFYSYRKLRAK